MTNEVRTTYLRRDVSAVQIPAGNTVVLPAGTDVDLAQTLGGSYTVRAMGGLFRIEGRDGDALGLEGGEGAPAAAPVAVAEEFGGEAAVWEALKTCFDPEIPVNIVDLGLIYDLHIEPSPQGGHAVAVKMTLTAPGCGMGPVIAGDAQQKIAALPGVGSATVEVVWDPPWHQSMITAEGRRLLGLDG